PRKRAQNWPQLPPGLPVQGLFPAVRDEHHMVFAFPVECFNVSYVCMICPVVNYERFTNNRCRHDSRNCQTSGVSPAKLENLLFAKSCRSVYSGNFPVPNEHSHAKRECEFF